MARILLALLFFFKIGAAFAQAPPPVPALPDTERRTAYTITASTCACTINFSLYGDGTDYQDWVEVWLNGVLAPYNSATVGWTITSPSGTIGSIPLPISNAILTFNAVQTGTVEIVGARRPRRVAQFSENQGVPARALNQTLNDIVAQNREEWDKTNDLTGRGLFFAPGNVTGPMPQPVQCENSYLGFDATGLNPVCFLSLQQPTLPLAIVNGGTGVTSFAVGGPVLGGLTALSTGTTSGNTTAFTTKDGTITNGHCVQWDSAGGLIDAGAACGSGAGGSGTVSSALAGNLAYYASAGTAVSGLANGSQGSVPTSGGVGNSPTMVMNSINVTAYGAKCDGSTDDTTAIRNAIAAAEGATLNPGRLVFPPATVCVVTGTLTATAPILINCQGAEIKFGAGVTSGVSMIDFAPTGAQAYRGWGVSHCYLNMNSEGAHTIELDSTATNSTELAEVEIDHVTDAASANASGDSILINNVVTNTNGGTFNTNFHDNVFFNGIYLNYAGDSIRIQDNILSGTKFGVYASLISGAGGLLIKGNNITAAKPIDVDGAFGTTVIRDNEIEQEVANLNPNGGLIDLNASVNSVAQIIIQGNSIHDIESNCCAVPLYITSGVTQALVSGNSFQSHLAATACIGQFGTATIGPTNQFITCTTNLSGTGTTTSVTTHSGYP